MGEKIQDGSFTFSSKPTGLDPLKTPMNQVDVFCRWKWFEERPPRFSFWILLEECSCDLFPAARVRRCTLLFVGLFIPAESLM